ncbi:APC family permease [Actinocorallia aurea]
MTASPHDRVLRDEAAPPGESAAVGLPKTLRRLDIVALAVAAVISLDTLGAISINGGEAFTWTAVLAVFFLVPYALIFSELGSAFPQEGGPYVWVKLAFGKLAAGVTTLFYWVTNPVWIGGSLVFLAADTWDGFVFHLGSGTVADYVFKLVFIWLTILTAIVSLRTGKWITIAGAVAKIAVVVVFVGTALAYGAKNGFAGLEDAHFTPTMGGFLAVVPVLLFAYVGFEAPNGAGEEMRDPQRDVPAAVGRSAGIAVLCYLLPVFAIIAVTPSEDVTGLGGFFDAVQTVFSLYGGAADGLLTVTAVVFVFALLNQGSAWMIVSDRMQAMAAADGGFFSRKLGAFHPRLGTPVRVNLLSGVTATVFLLAAMQIVDGTSASIFGVVLTVAITTLLMSYLVIIPAAARLRRTHPDTPRPYRAPAMAVCCAVVLAWIAVGSWVALFPGTLESLFGQSYDFVDSWGVSRLTFESFTLGTVAVLLVLGVVGHLTGDRDR